MILKLTVKSLRTSDLAEARRKIGEIGTLALAAAREPAVSLPGAAEAKAVEVKATPPAVPAVSLEEALNEHRGDLVLLKQWP